MLGIDGAWKAIGARGNDVKGLGILLKFLGAGRWNGGERQCGLGVSQIVEEQRVACCLAELEFRISSIKNGDELYVGAYPGTALVHSQCCIAVVLSGSKLRVRCSTNAASYDRSLAVTALSKPLKSYVQCAANSTVLKLATNDCNLDTAIWLAICQINRCSIW